MDRRLLWLALGTFAIGVEGFVIATLLPGIASDTGVSLTQAGYLVFGYAIAYAIGAPVLSTLTGRFDRRVVLASAALVFSLGALLAALAAGYGWLLVARIIIAANAGLYAATAQATAVTLAPPDRRARAVAVVVGGTTLAVAFGAPLGAFIGGLAGWRGTYFVIAAVGVITAGLIWLLLPAGIKGDRRSLGERMAVLKVAGMSQALLANLLFMIGPFAAFVYLGPITTRSIGLDAGLLPAVMLAFGVGAALGNSIGGQLSDRFGPQRTRMFSAFAATVMLVGVSTITLLPAAMIVPAYFALMFIWGITAWMFLPAQVSHLVALAPNSAPLALSLNASALYLGTAGGALIGGQVLERLGVGEIGFVAALFPLAALVLISGRQQPAALPRMG